jgi:hypothetical protein
VARHRRVTRGARIEASLLGVLASVWAWANDDKPNLTESLQATSSEARPLNLLLTQSELVAVVRNYEIKTGEVHTAPIDDEEILVIAPGYVAPMRDASQDVGGGILAPFWAIMHPRDAWRIFVPIPPKGPLEEAKPIRAEDRVTRPISALESTGMPSN